MAQSIQPWQEAVAEIWDLFKASQAEFDRRSQETKAGFKEVETRFKETDKQLRRLEGLFGMQWGRMMEALVQPAAVQLFQERQIDVHTIAPRVKHQRNGHMMELDLVLENASEMVILEVKTALRVQDVQDFLDDLSQLFEYAPRYRGYRVYAGVAGLDILEGADRFAYRQGLFVLKVGEAGLVRIMNDAAFQPKDFGQMEHS